MPCASIGAGFIIIIKMGKTAEEIIEDMCQDLHNHGLVFNDIDLLNFMFEYACCKAEYQTYDPVEDWKVVRQFYKDKLVQFYDMGLQLTNKFKTPINMNFPKTEDISALVVAEYRGTLKLTNNAMRYLT